VINTTIDGATLYLGDALNILAGLPEKTVNTCVTSPPYFGLRDYGHEGQIGLEQTPDEYVAKLVEVFAQVRRVLRDDGTVWLNLGDSYARSPGKGQHKPGDAGKQNYIVERGNGRAAGMCVPNGLKEKDLIGIPWRVAFALQADGWYLRQDIIWHKPNPMPESVTDRCTKAHEYIFLLSKAPRYYYDQEAILEPTSPNTNMRLSQNLAAQIGSHRAHGGTKTNGPMKAVSR
jgi:DNA modification methylase